MSLVLKDIGRVGKSESTGRQTGDFGLVMGFVGNKKIQKKANT